MLGEALRNHNIAKKLKRGGIYAGAALGIGCGTFVSCARSAQQPEITPIFQPPAPSSNKTPNTVIPYHQLPYGIEITFKDGEKALLAFEANDTITTKAEPNNAGLTVQIKGPNTCIQESPSFFVNHCGTDTFDVLRTLPGIQTIFQLRDNPPPATIPVD